MPKFLETLFFFFLLLNKSTDSSFADNKVSVISIFGTVSDREVLLVPTVWFAGSRN